MVLLFACSRQEQDPVVPEYVPLNISFALQENRMGTKSLDAVVQDGTSKGDFRGIDEVTLIPFSKAGVITDTDNRLGYCEQIENVQDLNGNSSAPVYSGMLVPIRTASFLFYGKATDVPLDRGNAADEAALKRKNGSLIPKGLLSSTPEGISFLPEAISASSPSSQLETKLSTYLTGIANASSSALSFKSAPLYASLFNNFINGGKLMAGSSRSIELILTELYNQVNLVSEPNQDYTNLKKEIKDAILSNGVEWRLNGEKYEVKLPSNMQGYPGEGLPDGSAAVKWNGEEFLIGDEAGAVLAPFERFCYPIPLWYYCNTTIRTSEDKTALDDLDTYASWLSILANQKLDNTIVKPETVCLAMVNQIHYGVGLMEMTIARLTKNTLIDASDSEVAVDNSSFPVTGIILGGQIEQGFDFTPSATPNSSANGYIDFNIFDTQFSEEAYVSSTMPAVKLRTLSLTSRPGDVVNFAIELENNSTQAFTGASGIILPGCKFYLLGQLDIDKVKPKEKLNGHTRVFEADHKTIVNVSVESFREAYCIIPDLRQPQLQVGVRVNFDWDYTTTNVPVF